MGKVSVGGGGINEAVMHDSSALTASANVAINGNNGCVFTLTPGEDETITATNFRNGEQVWLVVDTSGTTSRTLTFGTGFRTTGTLATGTTSARRFVMHFVVVGGVLSEVSRTAAMA